MRLLMGIAFAVGMGSGCATVDHERAEMHERSANRAAAKGNYRKAAREQDKANELEWKASRAPLP